MPSAGTVSQKDHSSVTHQFDAFASARWINLEFCNNRYRAIFGCRQPARVKALGKDRGRRRLETQALGKVDRDLETWNNTDDNHKQSAEHGSPQKCGNHS